MLALLILARPAARAEGDRVLLSGTPDSLEQATRTVLAPWKLHVIPVSAELPANEALALRRARDLAAHHQAAAVIWLAPSRGGHISLWLYDTRSDKLVSRQVPASVPFDDPTAASVALSIKTLLLRHSTVAPESERDVDSQERNARSDKHGGAPPARSAAWKGTHAQEETSQRRALEALLLIRTMHPHPTELEPRLDLGLAWRPPALGGRYGLSISIEMGPAERLTRASFKGQLLDAAVAADLRRHFRLDQRFTGLVAAGASLHLVRIDGIFAPARDEEVIRTYYLRPSLDLGFDVRMPLGSWTSTSLAFRTRASFRWLDYRIASDRLLSGSLLDVGAGIGLIVQLH